MFILYESYGNNLHLHVHTHSFPTRRSSYLSAAALFASVMMNRSPGSVPATPKLVPLPVSAATWSTTSAIRSPSASVPGTHTAGTAACTGRSEEQTSELQSLMRISYAVFRLKKKIIITYK